jgi:hypothetical protein
MLELSRGQFVARITSCFASGPLFGLSYFRCKRLSFFDLLQNAEYAISYPSYRLAIYVQIIVAVPLCEKIGLGMPKGTKHVVQNSALANRIWNAVRFKFTVYHLPKP